MKLKILIVLLLNLFPALLLLSQTADTSKAIPRQHQKFDPARDAQKDINDAIELAKKSHKRILLDVGGEWCIWCHRLDSLFIQNEDLEGYLNKYFILVKINVSDENRNEKVLSKYPKVAGYPHLFVLSEKGKLLRSQNTEELEYPKDHPVKGHDLKKVFAFLRKWAKK